ncbi:MAG: 16S rRNA (cytidine(1402)-2'-O)-methyltransferase [Ahrensia sp.]
MSTHYQIGTHQVSAPPLEPGLYLVATPIGNLRDITIRALETLAACDVLACEDTRITRRLLERYGIDKRMVTYHEHNAADAGPKLLSALAKGQSVALVSDAGTPLVSDPGYRLVHEARSQGLAVFSIPGPSAVLAALSASGLPTDDFRFIGFLPAKQKAKQDMLTKHIASPATLICFEAPGRLQATLAAISDVMGNTRTVCVARELTKRFETIRTGPIGDLCRQFADETIKGEIVVLIAPAPDDAPSHDAQDVDTMLAGLLAEMSASKAAKEAATMTGLPKAELYARCLALKAGE